MSTKIESSYYLSQLLPYEPINKKNKELIIAMKEYNMLVMATEQAIQALENNDLEKFDALVGENACQIRAVKIAMIACRYLENSTLTKIQIDLTKIQIKYFFDSVDNLMKTQKLIQTSLNDFLKKHEFDIALTSDEFFFIQSFLLSKTKTLEASNDNTPLRRNDVANPKKLIKFSNDTVSRVFCEKLLKKLRQSLSKASVEFVREQAQLLKNEKLIKLCSENFTIYYNTCWPCVPMFWTYKTLLLSAQRERIPIVLYAIIKAKDQESKIIEERILFFQRPQENQFYEEMAPSENDLTKPAILVQGMIEDVSDKFSSKEKWKEKIVNRNIINVILAGAADHRQYPDSNEDNRIEALKNDEEFKSEYENYKEFKAIALNDGYAEQNPTTFFIQHVFPTVIRAMPQLIEKAKSLVQIDRIRS